MRLIKYERDELAGLCVREDQSILDAMRIMSNAGLRLIPVLAAQDGTFAGVVADGDLRRFLTTSGQIDAPVSQATNRKPSITSADLSMTEAHSTMVGRGIEYLPVVKDNEIKGLFVLWVTSDTKSLTAVIMVGGLGSRLAPLTDNCPKPMLELGKKPILAHIIEELRDQGVRRFVLCTNYLSEVIVNYFGDGEAMGVSITYVHEKDRMGTGGALSLIDEEQLSEPFLCLNGDILNNIDVDALRLKHQSKNWDATMVVRDFSYTVPYGVVKTSNGDDFLGTEEKPTTHFKINSGYYMLSKTVLGLVPPDQFYDLPSLFTDLRGHDMNCGTFLHKGRWIDIGDISELNRARAIFEDTQQ